MPKAKPKNTITYHYVKNVNKDFYVSKKIHEVMANIHNKFGVDISEKEQIRDELLQVMNAVGGFADSIFGKDDDTQNAAFEMPDDDENGFGDDQ